MSETLWFFNAIIMQRMCVEYDILVNDIYVIEYTSKDMCIYA